MKEYTYKNFNKETDHMLVDFDGTLHIRPREEPLVVLGPPVPEMLERVKWWLANGMNVKLFTARVSSVPIKGLTPEEVADFVAEQRMVLNAWCQEHIGQEIPITCEKSGLAYQLWDDRAVAIERNTGKILGINAEW